MKTLIEQTRALKGWVGGLAAGLALLAAGRAVAEDVHFDVLRYGTHALTNATVTGKSKTDVYVSHPGGLINVKIRDLDETTLFKLGLGAKPKNYQEEKPAAIGALTVAAKSPFAKGGWFAAAEAGDAAPKHALPSLKFPTFLLLGLAVGALAAYLFFCYCLKLIVEKSGNEPGIMVWLPVLQLFPMLQAANMSGWWVLGFCVPILNLVAHVLWAINVVKARQKSVWVTIALLLPVTNLVGFVYLAFSSAEDDRADKKPVRAVIVPTPEAVPEAPAAAPAAPQQA